MPPHQLGSPIQVAPTVITPDLAHSKVTEIGADMVFVSGPEVKMGLVGIHGGHFPPPSLPDS